MSQSAPGQGPGSGRGSQAAGASATLPAPGAKPRWRVWLRRLHVAFWLALLLVLVAAAALAGYEASTSRLQAEFLARLGREMRFTLEPGANPALRFPGAGPFDQRLGYADLPELLPRLVARDFEITAQARMSPRMSAAVERGLFAPYLEKTRAGLTLLDCRGEPLFRAQYPERVYPEFDAIPRMLVDSLLFIENRELLNDEHPRRNPAVEWDRFGRAVFDQLVHRIDPEHDAPGGSTLATQIEKYRHSPEGRTTSGSEKLRQMASASLRAYLGGEDTTEVRRRIVVDYLNTVPLAAKAGFGEVIGLGDGLWAWYGREFGEVNALLRDEGAPPEARALAYKQALSLMIAQRRPSSYLGEAGAQELETLTDAHLRLVAGAGIVTPALRDAALAQRLTLRHAATGRAPVSFVSRKAANAARTHLAALLKLPRLYDLDRLDLRASSTLDATLQQAVTATLREISDPDAAKAAGLMEARLLAGSDPSKVVYSFTLYERTLAANVVRVQTDNFDQPFDINEGTRLDLGSTAKLRTLVTYLEIVARLHERYSAMPPEALRAQRVAGADVISRWAIDWLAGAGAAARGGDASLAAMLEAAMDRTYSGNPAEGFFTGGGLHHFENFEREDDSRTFTVREGLRRSVNLVFVRLMRDVVRHTMFNMPGSSATLLEDADDPKRRDYLMRFADREGREFIGRFFRKYQGRTAQEAESRLLEGVRATPARLVAVYHAIERDPAPAGFAAFLARHLPDADFAEGVVLRLFEQHARNRYDLTDQGYLAGVHPLELWLVGFLREHPGSTLAQAVEASTEQRQEVYRWLFRTRHKSAQDHRIRTLVEVEAFLEIHRMWKRVGYPFDSLVPSYATSIGSSADRPAALAELMGILVNDGIRRPAVRLDALDFASDTPWETRLARRPAVGERVMPAEVAQVARKALALVVEGGTARRLSGAFKARDGTPLAVGGKTGTGDHRYETFGKGGALLSSRVISRSGAIVFYVGDRHFGTLTAHVKGPEAARYTFTSALPAQILKVLAPRLVQAIDREPAAGTACAAQAGPQGAPAASSSAPAPVSPAPVPSAPAPAPSAQLGR